MLERREWADLFELLVANSVKCMLRNWLISAGRTTLEERGRANSPQYKYKSFAINIDFHY